MRLSPLQTHSWQLLSRKEPLPVRKETGSRGPKPKQGQGLSEHQEMTSTLRSCGAGFSGDSASCWRPTPLAHGNLTTEAMSGGCVL